MVELSNPDESGLETIPEAKRSGIMNKNLRASPAMNRDEVLSCHLKVAG
ncbi:MAG: hypothetical protein JW976_11810 [Syntrophaceae bacterium]|nr:hypothetical protein [Syntrophaceae bacterium]